MRSSLFLAGVSALALSTISQSFAMDRLFGAMGANGGLEFGRNFRQGYAVRMVNGVVVEREVYAEGDARREDAEAAADRALAAMGAVVPPRAALQAAPVAPAARAGAAAIARAEVAAIDPVVLGREGIEAAIAQIDANPAMIAYLQNPANGRLAVRVQHLVDERARLVEALARL